MAIDWDLAVKVVSPLLALVVGAAAKHVFERRPRLISYLGHVSAFELHDANRTQVYTHAIVVRNTGRKAANNVRVGHYVLPDYKVFPPVAFSIVATASGGQEILIPVLVPGEQVMISYLYFPPLTWDRVNAYTKSDEGLARILRVLPTPQPPRWMIVISWFFVFVGAATVIYLLASWLRAFL